MSLAAPPRPFLTYTLALAVAAATVACGGSEPAGPDGGTNGGGPDDSQGGTNNAPTVTISSPADGTEVDDGAEVTFTGSASDPEDGDLSGSIAWSSSLDGDLGTGASVSATLSTGSHTIEAEVTDGAGASDDASIAVDVVAATGGVGESLTITAPAEGAIWTEGTGLVLSAAATDAQGNDITDQVSDDIAWESSVNGYLDNGATIEVPLSQGTHVISALIYTEGLSDQVTVEVGPMSGELGTGVTAIVAAVQDGEVSFIDIQAAQTVNAIDFGTVLSTSSEIVALTPDAGRAYVSGAHADGTLSVLDVASASLVERFDIGQWIAAVEVSADGGDLIMRPAPGTAPIVVDAATGAVTDTIEVTTPGVGTGTILASPAGDEIYAFSSPILDEDGNGAVIDADDYSVLEEMTTGPGGVFSAARTPDGTQIFLAKDQGYHEGAGQLAVFDVATRQTSEIALVAEGNGLAVRDVAVTPDGSEVWFAGGRYGIWIVDPVTHEILDRITYFGAALSIDFSADGAWAYVGRLVTTFDGGMLGRADDIAVFDVAERRVTATIPAGAYPGDIEVLP